MAAELTSGQNWELLKRFCDQGSPGAEGEAEFLHGPNIVPKKTRGEFEDRNLPSGAVESGEHLVEARLIQKKQQGRKSRLNPPELKTLRKKSEQQVNLRLKPSLRAKARFILLGLWHG